MGLAVVLGIGVVLVAAASGASRLLVVAAPVEVAAVFGGGLLPAEHAYSRYHVRWYPVTMVFLAFDMEMLFMYPWTLVVTDVGTPAVVEMFVFLAILLAGVLYAWREGAFRWV